MSLSEAERAVRQRLKDDFPHFAEKCLKIRTKTGVIAPLVLNRAQRHVHERLEAQKAATGKVRALLLKARQQGFSTYIAGRFYWQATHRRGTQVFILTHEQDATANLFGMVERYQAHNHPLMKPSTGVANAKALYFDRLDSGYSVGTAGARAVGRSKTIQLLHGSEVAFWKNAAEHFAGVVQATPDLPGTEIILESTANGVGGEFHARWQQAEAGIGDYMALFVPWFWSDEYRREPPDDLVLDEAEATYAAAHGLDAGQMAWRRAKIAELKDPILFAQEYPATAAEAFQTSGHDSFIPAELVLRARKAECPPGRTLVLGVDPARFGEDRFAIAWRAGRKVLKVETRTKLDTVQGANWVRRIIDAERPRRVFVDVGGQGAGVVDLLRDMGAPYDALVVAVNFGGAPEDPPEVDAAGFELPGPKNRRAEMWSRSKAWLADPAGADLPDRDALQADACAPGYRYDAAQRLILESKDEMRRRGARSPDEWDAVALTFAETVNEPSGEGPHLALPNYGFI